ncbi:hypothetical protein [Streptomyces sp. FH025]|uniref:hypothetical protein n=1 Tax=Streptomyces sp. FH025 TaxID=2815937 RepID=UPI001A9E0E47|nr:hypothetical protein [Streptomyces sp. FH025]MBO1414216.1 hypothetical protein [Streptomyces sp. FH025]
MALRVRVELTWDTGRLTDEHLSAALDTPDLGGLRQYADVLHGDRPGRHHDARSIAADTLSCFPGCAVVAVGSERELLVLARTGERVRVPRGGGPFREPALIGSLVHAWLVSGRPAADLLALVAVRGAQPRERASIRPTSRSASGAPSPR